MASRTAGLLQEDRLEAVWLSGAALIAAVLFGNVQKVLERFRNVQANPIFFLQLISTRSLCESVQLLGAFASASSVVFRCIQMLFICFQMQNTCLLGVCSGCLASHTAAPLRAIAVCGVLDVHDPPCKDEKQFEVMIKKGAYAYTHTHSLNFESKNS